MNYILNESYNMNYLDHKSHFTLHPSPKFKIWRNHCQDEAFTSIVDMHVDS